MHKILLDTNIFIYLDQFFIYFIKVYYINVNFLIVYNKFTRYKLLANNSKKYVKNVDKTCKIKNLIVE